MFAKKLLAKTILTLTLLSPIPSLAQPLSSTQPIFPEQIPTAIEINSKKQIPELLQKSILQNSNTDSPFIDELLSHSLNSNQLFIGTQNHKIDQYKSLDYIATPITEEKFQSIVKKFELTPHKNLGYNRKIYFIDNIHPSDQYFIGFRDNFVYITNDELILSDILLQPNPTTLHKSKQFQDLESFKPENYFLNIFLNFNTPELENDQLNQLINNLSIWVTQKNDGLNLKLASKLDPKLQSIFNNFTPKLLNEISAKNLIGFVSFQNLNQTILDLKTIFPDYPQFFDSIMEKNLTTLLTKEHLLTFHTNPSNSYGVPYFTFISTIENQANSTVVLEKHAEKMTEQIYNESKIQFKNTTFRKFTYKSNDDLAAIIGILNNSLIITNYEDLESIINSSDSIQKLPEIQNQLQKNNSYSLLLHLNPETNPYNTLFAPYELREIIKTSKNLTLTLHTQNNHLITDLNLTTDINELLENLNLTPYDEDYDYDYDDNNYNHEIIEDNNCNFADDNSIYSAYELCYYGIIEGYKENGKSYLKPNQPITRAEFLKMLIAIQEHKGYNWLTVMPSSYFNDVPENSKDWFASYIHKAKAHNYIKGYPDNTFRPNNTITHAESYQLLFQSTSNFVKPPNDFQIKHQNVTSSDWYYTALKTIFYNFSYNPNAEIHQSFPANTPITRKEAFDLLYDYLTY